MLLLLHFTLVFVLGKPCVFANPCDGSNPNIDGYVQFEEGTSTVHCFFNPPRIAGYLECTSKDQKCMFDKTAALWICSIFGARLPHLTTKSVTSEFSARLFNILPPEKKFLIVPLGLSIKWSTDQSAVVTWDSGQELLIHKSAVHGDPVRSWTINENGTTYMNVSHPHSNWYTDAKVPPSLSLICHHRSSDPVQLTNTTACNREVTEKPCSGRGATLRAGQFLALLGCLLAGRIRIRY